MSFFICTFCYLPLLRLHPRQRAFFFVLRLTSSLFPLQALRCKTGRTRHASRLFPCLYCELFLCFAPDFNSLSFAGSPLQDRSYTPHSPSFACLRRKPFLCAMSPSFCICRRTSDNDDCGIAPFFCHAFAASLFFVLRLASTLYPFQPLRCKTCRTRRDPRLLPCLARWYFILRMRSACFPPRDDDLMPTACRV